MGKKKDKFIERRLVGMHVSGGGCGSFPYCYAVYETLYMREGKVNEFYTKLERGHSIHTYPSFDELNVKKPSKRQKERFSLEDRYDLEDHINSAAILLRRLENAALKLDEFYGMKTGRTE